MQTVFARNQIGRYVCPRFFSSVTKIRQWPFIDRPSLNDAIRNSCREGCATWVIGGKGSGKTVAVSRFFDKTIKSAKEVPVIALTFDLENARRSDLSDSGLLARFLTKTCVTQLAQQSNPRSLLSLLRKSEIDLLEPLRTVARSRPLWSHLELHARSFDELWTRIAPTQAAAIEVLQLLRLSEDPVSEFEILNQILEACGKKVLVSVQHLECLPGNDFSSGPLKIFTSPPKTFSVFLECNDSLRTVWKLGNDISANEIVRVPDLPFEAVKAVFVPSLLSDDAHVHALFELCGGRVGLLEKVVTPLNILNEEQKVLNQEQEQRYRSGAENRPSSESKDLQVDPLIFKREVALRESLVTGVFKSEVDNFEESKGNMISQFEPIASLRNGMTDMEFKVFICESLRAVTDMLTSNGFLAIPAGKQPLDIAHPVVLGLLNANILMVNWAPVARIEIESPLKLFMLKTWYSACLDGLSLTQRMRYNSILARNCVHLKRQLEKLVK